MSTVIQRSYIGGELTPTLHANVDLVKYATGAKKIRNFMVKKEGGLDNRPGTEFIGEVKDSTSTVRLFPFVFDSDQTYLLEFGELYFRVIKDGSYITEAAKTITGITAADPAVVTSNSHGYSNGDEVFVSGIVGMTELNGRNFKVANVAANTFELTDLGDVDIDSSAYTAYGSAGTAAKIYEVTTVYNAIDLPGIRFSQQDDVITMSNGDDVIQNVSRLADDSWTIGNLVFDQTNLSGYGLTATGGTSGSVEYGYKAVTLDENNTILSSRTNEATLSADPSSGTPSTITMVNTTTLFPVDSEVRFYKRVSTDGTYGYIGSSLITLKGGGPASSAIFSDTGIEPDYTEQPGSGLTTSASVGSTANLFFQQRRVLGEGKKVSLSKLGLVNFFGADLTSDDSSPVEYSMVGSRVGNIKHFLNLSRLVVFTGEIESVPFGDQAGILTPTQVNDKKQSGQGSGVLRPLAIGGNAVYLQSNQSIVREFSISENYSDSYDDSDMTLFASHLFKGYSIVDWDYQKNDDSIVWAVRSDGVLLGCTYDTKGTLAWHRHDFDGGLVENVSVIPEGSNDYVYLTIKRTVNGRTTRYIERLSQRTQLLPENLKLMDSNISYDGRNTSATTMTLSGGTTWEYNETITLTASTSYFAATDVGKEIHITDSAGDVIRFSINAHSSATVVTGKPNKTVPAILRSVAVTNWSKAISVIDNLHHLEGENVSVFADGFVVASPFNDEYAVKTVASGTITLSNSFSVVHVGLPFISDLETLNIDSAQGQTMMDRKKNLSKINVYLDKSMGLFSGQDAPADDTVDALEGLTEIKIRSDEGYDAPIELVSGAKEVIIESSWNSTGSVFLRQVDPAPVTISAVAPAGFIPFK